MLSMVHFISIAALYHSFFLLVEEKEEERDQ